MSNRRLTRAASAYLEIIMSKKVFYLMGFGRGSVAGLLLLPGPDRTEGWNREMPGKSASAGLKHRYPQPRP
jgi:hypothetical protein